MNTFILLHFIDTDDYNNVEVMGAYMNAYDAKTAMCAARDKALEERYGNASLEAMKADTDYTGSYEYDENENHISIFNKEADKGERWEIEETKLEGSDCYIDIAFAFRGIMWLYRLYKSDIDLTNDDSTWSYSFPENPTSEDDRGRLFEIVGTKEKDRWDTHIRVNVYEDEYAMDPYMTIERVRVHRSWKKPIFYWK